MRGMTLGNYAASGAVGPGYAAAILGTSGLISYWPMAELSGPTCADVRGGNGGTYANLLAYGVGGATAGLGTAERFTGFSSSSYVNVPYAPALAPSAALSVECWLLCRGTTAITQEVICKPVPTNSNPYFDYAISTGRAGSGPGRFAFFLSIGGTYYEVTSASAPLNDTWYHVVGTYDGSFLRIYMNGVLDCTPVAASGPVNDHGTPLWFATAGSWNSEDFCGYLQHVALYGSALPAATVLGHFNAAS